MFLRRQTKPGGEVSPGREVSWLDRQGHGDRAKRTDAWNRHKQLADRIGLVQRRQLIIHSLHVLIQRLDMRAHLLEHCPCCGGDGVVSSQHAQQRRHFNDAFGRYHAEFRRMATQGIDRLGALAHQHLTMFEDDAIGLLASRLDHHRTHGGTRRGLADRLGIVTVILGPLDERLDVLRRDQANTMTQLVQQPAPVVRATAGLQHHLGRFLFGEEALHLGTLEFAPQHRTLLLIDAMEGKHVLGRIDRDALKRHTGGPWLRFDNSTWHEMPLGRPPQQPTYELTLP